MLKMKKIKNKISGIIISVMIFGTALPAQQVFASTAAKDISIVNGSNGSTKIQSNKLGSFEPYVSVYGNKYILNIPSNMKNSFSKADLTLANNRIKVLNNLITEYKVKDVSMKDGFTMIIDESKIQDSSSSKLTDVMMSSSATTIAGVTKIVTHWNYAEIWLSKSACKYIAIGSAGAVIGLFGVALNAIPVVGTVVASAISGFVGAVFGTYVASKTYRAVKVNFNYVNGIEWASYRYQ